MKHLYRVTVRFDLDDEEERRTADYLRGLDTYRFGSLNKFMINAAESYICGIENIGGNNFTLDDIRQVFREETRNISVAAPVVREISTDEQANNEAFVLDALEMFE